MTASLLENLLGKHGEVNTPVAPDMATIVLIVLVGVVMVIEVLAQVCVHLHEEIILANGYPIEFGLRVEEPFHLLVEILIELRTGCLGQQFLRHTGSCRLKSVVVEHIGVEP